MHLLATPRTPPLAPVKFPEDGHNGPLALHESQLQLRLHPTDGERPAITNGHMESLWLPGAPDTLPPVSVPS
jgi:hypothetical protein